nr:reverse transcriptase domain-containing protein [Tanacetum cinerariifolium]
MRKVFNSFALSYSSARLCVYHSESYREQEASPAIVEPLRIENPFLEDQFQKDPLKDPPEAELLRAPTEGYEDAIVIPEIAANNFKLKHGLINLVQNKQFFGHDKEDPHAHIRYFNKITSTMRVPNVPTSSIKLMLFPFSLEGAARIWLEKEAPRSILTWDDLVSKFINQFFPPSKTTNLRNEITRFQQRFNESFYEAWERFNDLLRAYKKNQSSAPASSSTPAPVKVIEPNYVTCDGTHSYQNCPATSGNVYRDNIEEYVSQAAAANYNQGYAGFRSQMVANQIRPLSFPPHQNNQNNFNRRNNFNQNRGGSGTLPSNTVTNPKEDLKGITTRSDVAYQGPIIPNPSKQGTEVTKDQVQTPSSQSTTPVQPPITQSKTQTPISEPVVAPISAPMPNLKPSIPHPSRRNNERRCDQDNEQIEKFYEIFKDMSFEISFTDALILMPKFASTLKALIENKEKLSEMAKTPMNEHCSAVILNKLPRKLGDPVKFLIPSEFPGMDECLALADLDVSVKVGVFHFSADFVVVEFEPDPRVPLILDRCFLKIDRALIDVHEGELTLRIGNEAITYNLDQTLRCSANYNQLNANKIDFICKEYSQEVLGLSDTTASGNPTPYDDPIVSTTSPTPTPFGDSDFLLFEEADAFLGLEDDPNSSKFDPSYYDPEGDILLLEAILNSEPLPLLPNHEQYMPSYKKELKVCEAKTIKYSVDEPPEVELKGLPPHIEYGINPEFYTHKILMEEDYKPAVQHQRRVNPKIHDVIGKEVEKLLDAGLICPISDSPWVCSVHCVPKKGGFTVVENEENELIPTRLVTGWLMLKRLAGNECYFFLDGFFGYFQIPIDPRDQEKTTFTCPYGTFAYRRMPFCLCNAPDTFQRCMLAIFYDMVEKTMEVFMDDFSVFGNSFENCLSHLDKMLQRLYQSFPDVKEKTHGSSNLDCPKLDLPFELMCDASDFAIGKLKTRWSGPFTIAKVFPYGTVELSQANGPNFKVNDHRVKHYFGGDVPQLVVPDLQTFPSDQ